MANKKIAELTPANPVPTDELPAQRGPTANVKLTVQGLTALAQIYTNPAYPELLTVGAALDQLLSSATYAVHSEVPVGDLNGVNTAFALTAVPEPASVLFTVNGVRLRAFDDYTLSGATLHTVQPPGATDNLYVTYWEKSGTGIPAGGANPADISYPAALNLSGQRVVLYSPGAGWIYADRTVPAHASAPLAVTVGAINAGAPGAARLSGIMDEPSWAWPAPCKLFLDTAGYMTAAVPTAGFLREVARAVSATRIFIEPEPAVILS